MSDMETTGKRPVLALLGEFSAGKSTLVNTLLNRATSPVRVTATHVPPIWYSYGDRAPIQVLRSGEEVPLHDDDLTSVPLDETRCIRFFLEADILRDCDLMDMPGSSDPNMTPDVWDTLLPEADGVIWCTPATQAWRQTEAAIWEEVPEKLYNSSLLLLTRIDKVLEARDRERLVARIRKETDDLFRGVFPVSLLQAANAPGDAEVWRTSGMAAFSKALQSLLGIIQRDTPTNTSTDLSALRAARGGAEPVETPRVVGDRLDDVAEPQPADVIATPSAANDDTDGPVVIPRRVTRAGNGRSARPGRASGEGSLI